MDFATKMQMHDIAFLLRDPVTGTWIIDCLCDVFMNHAFEMHLFQLLEEIKKELDTNPRYRCEERKVNRSGKMVKTEKTLKQNCTWTTTMTGQKIYFNCTYWSLSQKKIFTFHQSGNPALKLNTFCPTIN